MDELTKFFADTKSRYDSLTKEGGEKLENRIVSSLEIAINDVFHSIDECESPIEKIFSLDFHRIFKKSPIHNIVDIFEVSHQENVKIDEETEYRVDLMVEYANAQSHKRYQFIIECDGHDFHEKTKEQAAADKKRDRDLMEKGCLVIRFTGSEIYKDSLRCARQALNIIENFLLTHEKL